MNVGVWNGFTFLSGVAHNPDKICIGVDNFSQFGGPREAFLERFNRMKSAKHAFYDMDFEDYFRTNHSHKIGIVKAHKQYIRARQNPEMLCACNLKTVHDRESRVRQATDDHIHKLPYQFYIAQPFKK